MYIKLHDYYFCHLSSMKENMSSEGKWLNNYSVLLVVITVMDNNKAQVKALAQIKQVVCLRLSPAIVMEMHLIFLLWVHWYLHSLWRQTEEQKEYWGLGRFFLSESIHLKRRWQDRKTLKCMLFVCFLHDWLNLEWERSYPYLIEAGKRVVLAFLCHTSPVVEYGAIPASWICERHPLPGTHFFTAKFCFDCSVALSSVTRQQRWCISGD